MVLEIMMLSNCGWEIEINSGLLMFTYRQLQYVTLLRICCTVRYAFHFNIIFVKPDSECSGPTHQQFTIVYVVLFWDFR
jgi:hypothetical protein